MKLEWADQHINRLHQGIATFKVGGSLYTIARKQEPETGDVVMFIDTVRAIPNHFSLIAGDALNGLRSALDYLVRAMVTANNQQPPRKCGFPIFTDPKLYDAMSPGMIKGISDGAAARIHRLQPFHAGAAAQDHPLWMLHELNNTDKHKLVLAVTARLVPNGSRSGADSLAPICPCGSGEVRTESD